MPPKKAGAAAVPVAIKLKPRFVIALSPDITLPEERQVGADPLILTSTAKNAWKGVKWLVRVLPGVIDSQKVMANGVEEIYHGIRYSTMEFLFARMLRFTTPELLQLPFLGYFFQPKVLVKVAAKLGKLEGFDSGTVRLSLAQLALDVSEFSRKMPESQCGYFELSDVNQMLELRAAPALRNDSAGFDQLTFGMLVDPRSACLEESAAWLLWVGPRFLASSRTAEDGAPEGPGSVIVALLALKDLFLTKKPGMSHLSAIARGRAMLSWSVEVGSILRMELDDVLRAQSCDLAAADFIDRMSYGEKSAAERAIHFQSRAAWALKFYRRLSVLLAGAANRDICLLVARLNRELALNKSTTGVVDLDMLDAVEAALLPHEEAIRDFSQVEGLKLDAEAAAMRVVSILERHSTWVRSEKHAEKGLENGEGATRAYSGSTEVMSLVQSARFTNIAWVIIAAMEGSEDQEPISPAQVLLLIIKAKVLLLYKFVLGFMGVSRPVMASSPLLEKLSLIRVTSPCESQMGIVSDAISIILLPKDKQGRVCRLMQDFRFSHKMCLGLIKGEGWEELDFEEFLIFEVEAAKKSLTLKQYYARREETILRRAIPYTSLETMKSLRTALGDVFSKLLGYDQAEGDSFTSTITEVIDALKLAQDFIHHELDVMVVANRVMRDMLGAAGGAYARWVSLQAPEAETVSPWLPSENRSMEHLRGTVKQMRKYRDQRRDAPLFDFRMGLQGQEEDAFGWSYELRGWNQGLRCGWRADLLRLASVKGRALPTVLNAVEAEEEAAPSIKGKRKALSLASEASYKRKSTAEEEDPGWKGSLMWMKLEEEFKANADSIVGKLASAVTMDRKNGTVTRGRFVYSIQKLQAKLGKDICLPVAIGTSRITQLNCVFCPHKGEAGHEIKGGHELFTVGDNLIGAQIARLVEFSEADEAETKQETKPSENRVRRKGELHTEAEQGIDTLEQVEEKLENIARREAWRMVSWWKEESESRNGGCFDIMRDLEEGRSSATGKKVGLLSAFAGMGSCEMAAAKLGVVVLGYWEIDTAACVALEILAPLATNLGDIKIDNMRVVRELMGSCDRVIMTAGVPCQSFSRAGNKSFNGELLDATISVAVAAQVNYLLVECVPDLVRRDELFDQEKAEWRTPNSMPERPALEGWHRECSNAIKKAATGGFELIDTRFLKDWEHDGATTRERVFLFFDRSRSGRPCMPLCVVRCTEGGDCRDLAGALSPVELVEDRTIVSGCFIPSGVEISTKGETRLAGWLLFSLPLVVGAIVCTQRWKGKGEDGNGLRISGKLVGGGFLCADKESTEAWVAQSNLSWMPVGERSRPLLRAGMLVGIAGDAKWHKLLELMADGKCRVSYKNKAKVRYGSVVLAQVVAVKIERLRVLDPKGLGLCLRRYGDMPQGSSFLVLDARFDVPVVRRLMGTEAWKLHNLSPELLLELFRKGMAEEEFGKLAGNAIPQGLANAVVSAIVSRGEVEDVAEALTVAGMPMTAPEAKANGLKRVTLCVIRLGSTPELLCLDGCRDRLMVGADIGCKFDKGDELVELLGSWANRLVAGTAEAFLYAQDIAFKRRDFVALTVAGGAGHLPAGTMSFASLNGFKWQGVSTIGDPAVQRLAWRAIAMAHSFMSHGRRVEDSGQWEEAQREVLRSAQSSGKLQAGLVHAARAPTAKGTWSAALERDMIARELLKAEIVQRIEESDCDDARESWRIWSDCITPLAALELPAGIEAELHVFDEEALVEVPFINRCRPEKSAWLPQKQNQTPPLGHFNPQSAEELLHPWAWAAIQKWVGDELVFLRDIRRYGADATRKTKEVLALGQEAFVKEAQGKYWDCRDIKPKLLDYSQVEPSHINFDVLRTHGSVDKELESFFEFGMDYKADNVLPQIVGLPHLQSLSLGYPDLIDEVRRCGEEEQMRNFFSIHRRIPFLPCRFGSKGTAPKKGVDKRGRPKRRPTNEFGAPRKRKLDSGGLEVTPLNVAIMEDEHLVGKLDYEGGAAMGGEARGGFAKWAHENKTRFVDVMRALAIMIHVGQLMKVKHSVYAMSDDCRVYFNQLRTRTSQYPLTTFVADDEEGDAVFVVEKGMTFGPSSASQIAQRVANHLVDWFYSLMDKLEAEFVAEEARLDPSLATWLKKRHGGELWSTQGRLYAIFMYTDDPLILGVGAARMVRLVAEWDRMTGSINLLMNPEKRNLGTSLVWIGMGIITSLGLAYIPLDKAIRIVAKLQLAVAGTLMLCDYKALLGALEHVLYVSGRDRQYMMSLWHPFKGYREVDPNNFLKPSVEQSAKLKDWLKFVLSIGGVSAIRAVSETVEQRALAVGRVVYTASSDAYAEEGAEGLGFYMHGMWGFFDIPERLRGLPISTLEFLAAAWAIKTLLPIFTLAEGGAIMHIRVDAIATCFSLQKRSQKSELLQTVHSELFGLKEFQEGKENLVNSHIAGLANVGADKASRPKKRDQLKIWAALLGIELTLVEAPTTWLEEVMGRLLLVHDEVSRLRRLKQEAKERALSKVEQSLGLRVPCTQDSASETVKAIRGRPRIAATNAFEASLEKLENLGARLKSSSTMTHASKSLEAVWQAKKEEPEEVRVRAAGRERRFNSNAFESACQELTGLDKKRNAVSLIARSWEKEVVNHGVHLSTDWLVKSIERDKSQYSIGKTPLMRIMIRKAHRVQMLGRNTKVQKANEGAWRRWLSFCDACNIKPIRDDFDANSGRDREGHAREVELLVTALMVTLPTMKGRGKVADALPGSALNWIRAIRKVHQEMSPPIIMVPINSLDSTMKGLLKEFQLKHGVKASLAQRKEPLRNEHIRALLSLWYDEDNVGKTVAKLVIGESEAETAAVRAIWQLLLETGFRLSEITDDHWDIRRASRGSVSFRIRGIFLNAPTREQLMDMGEGDIVLIEPPPSKPDPTGRIWGCKPIFLPFHPTRQTCAARALRDMELALPLAAKCRRTTPLFVDPRTGCSFKGNRIRTLFEASLRKFMSVEETQKYSPHSFRITLGCKLRAAGATDMEIMSLCRWQTLESLAIYCRLTPEDYGRLLNKAYKADAASIQVTNIPDVGPQE